MISRPTAGRRTVGFQCAVLLASLATVRVGPALASTKRVSQAALARPTAQLSLVAQDFQPSSTGGTFRVDVAIDKLGLVANPLETEVVATVHQRIKSRAAFRSATLGDGLGAVVGFVSVPGASAAENANGTLIRTLRFETGKQSPQCPQCVSLDAEGVYPVQLELRRPGGEQILDSFTTFVVQHSSTATSRTPESLKVALVVPINTPPRVGNGGTPETASLISMSEALASERGVPLTIAATPQTLDQNSDLLDTLRGALANREVLTMPYVNVNPATLGLPSLKGERQRLLSLGRRTLREQLGVEPFDGVFVGERMVSDDVLDDLAFRHLVLAASAVEKTVPLPSASLITIDPGARSGRTTAARTTSIADSQLANEFTAKLSNRTSGSDDLLRAEHVVADLSLIDFLSNPQTHRPIGAAEAVGAVKAVGAVDATNTQHGVTVVLPERTAPGTLVGVLRSLQSSTQLEPVVLSNFFGLSTERGADGRPVLRLPVSDKVSTTRSERGVVQPSDLKRFQAAVVRRNGYESMFVQPIDPRSAADLEILTKQTDTLLSDRFTDSSRALAIGEFGRILDRLIGKVSNQTSKRITLTARTQPVQIAIVNDTGRTIQLRMIVETDTALLPEAKVDPKTSGRQMITRDLLIDGRVHREQVSVATNGPGRYSMIVSLQTPDGYLLSQTRYAVQATSIGIIGKVLTIGSLLVLGGWWIRTTIASRRRRAISRHPALVDQSEPPQP